MADNKSKHQTIVAKSLVSVFGCSRSQSYREIKKIRSKLNKEKQQKVTAEEIAIYYGVPVNFIVDKL